MKMLLAVPDFELNELDTELFNAAKVRLIMARLDKIHPVISGNKLFKLHYFLEEAMRSDHKTILTFGGAYSNHLVATAYSCKISGLKCIGIVRGERAGKLSHTLLQCEKYGMHLKFVSREEYKAKDLHHFKAGLFEEFGKCILIPEGGYAPLGAKGASLIMNKIKPINATHVCTAVGTATTFAGLAMNAVNNEMIIGVPVLKGLTDIEQRLSFLCDRIKLNRVSLLNDYHFGGYAKKTKGLLDFMNDIYLKYNLPTDFVYTAKMMYAVLDKIKAGFFPEGSIIVCLHTGGLQGNDSLPAGTLVF